MRLKLFGGHPALVHFLSDFVDVIEIISKRGMHAGQRGCTEMRNDFVGAYALMLMQQNDVKHANTWPAMTALPPQTPGVLVMRSWVEPATTHV